MPSLYRACAHPGCTARIQRGHYCDAHQPARQRPTATHRGYDAQWQRVRDLFLAKYPLCTRCTSRNLTVAAEVVHHIRPVEARPDLRLDFNNLEALCRACHERLHGRLT